MRERALLCTVTPDIARSAGSSSSRSTRSWACTAFIASSIRSRRLAARRARARGGCRVPPSAGCRSPSPVGQAGDEVDGGGRAGHQLVGEGAELEPLGHGIRRRQQLVGVQGLEQRRVGGEHPAVRPHELVGRAGPEVGAQRREVDRGVGGGVHPVDPVQGPDLVGQVGDAADRRAGADQVRGRGRGDEPGALAEHGGDGIRGQLAGGGVEVDPPHRRPGRLGDLHPRAGCSSRGRGG